MGQALFQIGAETVISKWVKAYFKLAQKLFQSGAVIPKRGKILFQSAVVKWDNCFKVGVTLRLIGEETSIKNAFDFTPLCFFLSNTLYLVSEVLY